MIYKEESTKRVKQEIKSFNDFVNTSGSERGVITIGVMIEMLIMKVAKLEDEIEELKELLKNN